MRTAVPVAVLVLVGSSVPSPAQEADRPQSAPDRAPMISRTVPALSSPTDQFDVKTIDSGRDVQRRLELKLPNSKDTFIFGDKTTSYPLGGDPADFTRPLIPQQDHYTFGIGKRF